jgi:hypothetical protein
MNDKRRFPEAKRIEARDLLREGLTIAEVSHATGLSYQGVKGIATSFGIEARRSRIRRQSATERGGGAYPIAPVYVVTRAVAALGAR